MTKPATVPELRNAVSEILSRPEMEHWWFYEEQVRQAAKSYDLDQMELIHWYFTSYWDATPEEDTTSLNSLIEALYILKEQRGYTKAAHFFTVESMQAIDSFAAAVNNRSSDLTGYSEMVNEIFIRPEAGPVMTHLICDRNITSWEVIAPLLDDLLSSDSRAMTSGLL